MDYLCPLSGELSPVRVCATLHSWKVKKCLSLPLCAVPNQISWVNRVHKKTSSIPLSNQHHGGLSPLLQKFPGQYTQRYKVRPAFLPALSLNPAIKLHLVCESLLRPWLTEFETLSLGHRKSKVFSCSCSSTSTFPQLLSKTVTSAQSFPTYRTYGKTSTGLLPCILPGSSN